MVLRARVKLAEERPLIGSSNWWARRHGAQQHTRRVSVAGETAEHSKYSIDPIQFCSVFEKIIEFK